jgi:hypothetical protein
MLRCAAWLTSPALQEEILEKDALRFDAFLKENDMRAVEAIKRAEAETKTRAEAQQEIRKLTAQLRSAPSGRGIVADVDVDVERWRHCN